MGDLPKTFQELGWYVMTAFVGFLIQGIILYPTLYGKMLLCFCVNFSTNLKIFLNKMKTKAIKRSLNSNCNFNSFSMPQFF